MTETAVEWLCNEWLKLDLEFTGLIDTKEYDKRRNFIIEQAKAMEKEQSECICVNVISRILDESEQGKEINSKEIFEKCYNETFKSE